MGDVELTCCNGTYARGSDGVWRYPWGDPVPGAVDLTVADAFELGIATDPAVEDGSAQFLTAEELAWVLGTTEDSRELVRRSGSHDDPARVLGMLAPELNAMLMLTVADIAELAGVSKATVDSYRYRGYLPVPQVVRSRTPLWARPIVRRWLVNRPGSGWRTDVYGFRERMSPPRKLPISRARGAIRSSWDAPEPERG